MARAGTKAAGGGLDAGLALCRRLYQRWVAPLLGALALFNIFGTAETLRNLSRSVAWLMGWYRAALDLLLVPLPFRVPELVADALVLYLILSLASVRGSRHHAWPPVAAARILWRFLDRSERYHDRAIHRFASEGRARRTDSGSFVITLLVIAMVAGAGGVIVGQVNARWLRVALYGGGVVFFAHSLLTFSFRESRRYMAMPRPLRLAVGMAAAPMRWLVLQGLIISAFLRMVALVVGLALCLWGLDRVMLHLGGSIDVLIAQLPQPPPRR